MSKHTETNGDAFIDKEKDEEKMGAKDEAFSYSKNDSAKDDREKRHLWRKLSKDLEYRSKVLHSLCIAMGFFCIGATEALGGPTFLDLQIVTSTNAETASIFFTVHSIGCLAGCVVAAPLTKMFRRSFLISSNLLCMALVTIATPHCSTLTTMIVAKVVAGIFAGIVDTHLNADHMKTWGNQGHVLMQLLHFMFALGGLVSPLISAPFLTEKDNTGGNVDTAYEAMNATDGNSSNSSFSYVGLSTSKNPPGPHDMNLNGTNLNSWMSTVPEVTNHQSSGIDLRYTTSLPIIESEHTMSSIVGNSTIQNIELDLSTRSTNVHFAFLITGIGTSLVSIPFIIKYLNERRRSSSSAKAQSQNRDDPGEGTTTTSSSSYRKIPRNIHYFSVVLLCSFYLFYCGIEDTFASLLMMFLVREYNDVTKSQAAHILAIFWSCFALSRFLMIFLANRFSRLRLLTFSVCFMFLSLVTFTSVAGLGQVVLVSVVSGLVGFCMSGIFACGFSWSESEYVHVTGSVSACILIASISGVMLNPMLVVRMMEHRGPMSFCYVFTVEAVFFVAIFASLVLFNRKYLNRKFGPLRIPVRDQEVEQNGLCMDASKRV